MRTAKAFRQVEILARIVSTYEDEIRESEGRDVWKKAMGYNVSLAATVRDLKLALVELDIARSAEGLEVSHV
jgi:hypothetical protein